jgi:hypothetical protein
MLCQITRQPAPLDREWSAICHDAAGDGTAAVEGFLLTCGASMHAPMQRQTPRKVKQLLSFVQQRQHQSNERRRT